MTMISWALLGLAALAAGANWVSRARGDRLLEYATKPTATALLLAVAATVSPADPTQRLWFVAALALSLAGDVLLMLPRDRFIAGVGAFLLAHAAYIVGFWVAGVDTSRFLVGLAVVALAVAPVAVRIVWSMRDTGAAALAPPVVVYMVVIATMVASAVGSGSVLATAGAATFMVSDALIAWDRFVRPLRWASVAIMVTYHLGQAGLVLAIVG